MNPVPSPHVSFPNADKTVISLSKSTTTSKVIVQPAVLVTVIPYVPADNPVISSVVSAFGVHRIVAPNVPAPLMSMSISPSFPAQLSFVTERRSRLKSPSLNIVTVSVN